MHETTAVVLLVIVVGQILIFTIAGIAMWVAGEFGERPQWRRWRKQSSAGEASGSRAEDAAPPSGEHDGLVTLHHDLPIAPREPDDGAGTTANGRGTGDVGMRMTGGRRR